MRRRPVLLGVGVTGLILAIGAWLGLPQHSAAPANANPAPVTWLPSASPTVSPTPSLSPTPSPSPSTKSPTPKPKPVYAPFFGPGPVTVKSGGYLSWAWLDRHTGKLTTSSNPSATSDTASMIKAWLVSDNLRMMAAAKQKPSSDWLNTLSIAIRDSDNNAAQAIYNANGQLASINRLIKICKLTDSHGTAGYWSLTFLSARDAVRMGLCIADGRGAGPQWTSWVLNEMRHVRGEGRFGIIDALPASVASTVAIKNGWLLRDEDGIWRINCLAIGDTWVLAVMMRYPGSLGQTHGENVCRDVTAQLRASRS